jgi:hypothetical protein
LQPLKHTPVYAKALARLRGRADERKRAKTNKPSPESPAGHADGFQAGGRCPLDSGGRQWVCRAEKLPQMLGSFEHIDA